MDHKHDTDWTQELLAIAKQSPDHAHVAHIVRSHTHAAFVEKRALTIAVLVSAAIAVLLREDDPYFLSTAAGTAWIFTSSFGLLEITGTIMSNIGIRKLRQEDPQRLKHILQEIRSKTIELAPVVDQVERALFDSSQH